MKTAIVQRFGDFKVFLRRVCFGPQALAFLPAIVLAAFWLGGEPLLIASALGLPLLFLVAGGSTSTPGGEGSGPALDLVTLPKAEKLMDATLEKARATNMSTACMVVDLAGDEEISQASGNETFLVVQESLLRRMRGALRKDDTVVRTGDSRFLIVLGPSVRLDLESLLQLASRLQASIEEPVQVDDALRHVSATIGFCSSSRMVSGARGKHLVEAALVALDEALGNGPSSIRAWSENMRAAQKEKNSLKNEVDQALSGGQIQPWFQPQICTSTGEISGVEALARWIHPERGIIPPAQFLRILEETGKMERLSEVILQHSLTALRSWDQVGLNVPRVSVNFSDTELRDPRLVERIQWELDRFGLTPQRLGIEVLETVIAGSPEGIVSRNIVALGEMGCHIDLDDFGTGHASITALRRFRVHRLKIDRSFVTRIDRDEDQHRMLAAVLGMADRLDLATLAEGVESVGEHALLGQLGCDHVQGFGIARPMPPDQLVTWAKEHAERISEAQNLSRRSG
jgi:EAL domain-containing protein (putative c-di-GMP-specific phosphodiesterase class I)/GGDEF domain-containing protein